jgi:hypothetical protein
MGKRIKALRTLREAGGGSQAPVQREEASGGPSLFPPRDPASKYRLGGDMELKLSPEFLAMAARYIDEQVDFAKVKPALGQVNYTGPGLPKVPAPAAPAAPGAPGPHPAVDPKGVPSVPEPQPIVPKGAGPDTPKAAGVSDLAEAVAAIPAVEGALGTLKNQAKSKVSTDWGKLKPGEKAAVVTTLVSIGLPALGAAASDPGARDFLLSQVNGKILPVPKVPWLNLEVNTEKGNLMVGLHVDVGRLLPPSLGFGPGSPTPIGGPPEMAGQRTPGSGGPLGVTPLCEDAVGLSDRIRSLSGQGAALPAPIRERFETGLGADLAAVRVHTGAEADRLARAVDAVAFTTGSDIFFRAGAFAPGTEAGLRLLAHEATHTVQQAAGPVTGIPVGGGVAISDPHDGFERAAERTADRLARGFAGRAAQSHAAARQPGPASGTCRVESAGHRWENISPLAAPSLRGQTRAGTLPAGPAGGPGWPGEHKGQTAAAGDAITG